MANDETWSAKCSPETKDELAQLIKDSGLTSGEFLEQLLINHKVTLLQGSEAERSEDIQQVTYYADKIKAAFIALVEKGSDLAGMYAESLEREAANHKSIVEQLQQTINQKIKDKEAAECERAEMAKSIKDVTERNADLSTVNSGLSMTVQLQQDKIASYESRIDTVSRLEQEINRLKADLEEQHRQNQTIAREALEARHQAEAAKAAHEVRVRELQIEAEQQAKFHQLELDNAVLQAEKTVQESYLAKTEALNEQIKAMSEMNQTLFDKVHKIELAAKPATGSGRGKKHAAQSEQIEGDETVETNK